MRILEYIDYKMGFWDFFKRNKKQIIEIEKVPQNELEKWLSTEKAKIKEQEQNYLEVIKERILALVSELEQEILILKNINVNERRAEEKIKLIVRENLKNYIGYAEELTAKLKEIEESGGIIEKINSVFPYFQKRSAISYEKATFLIGKEIGDIKDSIRKFYENIEQILIENKEIIEKSKIIKSVEEHIEENRKVKETISEISVSMEEYDNRINKLKNNMKIKEKEIENIKKSEKFLEISKKKQELESKKQELERSMDKLREIIDFKALGNFYHIFEKEMGIIKEHKENFKQAFKKTKGEELISLLRESNLNNINILNKLREIEEKEKEIKNTAIEQTGIESIEKNISNIKSEIEAISSEKLIKERRFGKMQENLDNTISSIKGKLVKMNVELVQ